LPEELYYQYNPSSHYIPAYNVLPLYYTEWRKDRISESLSFLDNPHLAKSWQEFKQRIPLGTNRIINIPSVR
jgi:hypothetical protein